MYQPPLLKPSTDWKPPHIGSLPDLRQTEGFIGFDTETYEPDLLKLGSQFPSGLSRVVGISLATKEHGAFYLPFDHEDGGNLGRREVINYARLMLGGDNPKVGANIPYDLEALHSLRIEVRGQLNDVQVAGPLIDEEALEGYRLEVLAKKYVGEGKDETLLKEAAAAYGVDPKSGMWRMHSSFVGPYGEADAMLPILIIEHQIKEMQEQDLMGCYRDLEMEIVPILFQMRLNGVPLDVSYLEQQNEHWYREEKNLQSKLKVDPWSSGDIERLFLSNGWPYPRTPSGNPSFEGEFLLNHHDPMVQQIAKLRSISKMRRDFMEHYLEMQIDGRLHPNINALRKDNEGTRSGRLSMSRPNLQQVPSRDPLWNPIIRSAFIPEPGMKWARLDYSQQEPRILVHYAAMRKKAGAEELRDQYVNDPSTDFHQAVADMSGLERRDAKDINLGMFYGMGQKKLARQIGRELNEARAIFDTYHGRVPFVRAMSRELTNLATDRGYIRTLSGRRAHFDFWEASDNWKSENWIKPVKTWASAREVEQWEGKILRRSWCHKGLNRLVQGGAADMTKKAMIECFKEGYLAHIQVHDELDLSVETPQDGFRIKEIMEHAYELSVPSVADLEFGLNWGTLVEATALDARGFNP